MRHFDLTCVFDTAIFAGGADLTSLVRQAQDTSGAGQEERNSARRSSARLTRIPTCWQHGEFSGGNGKTRVHVRMEATFQYSRPK